MISLNSAAAHLEAAFDGDREFERLSLGNRLSADLAGGGLKVLLLDGLDHVGGRDQERRHLVRVEPDPHRILAAEYGDIADARDSLQDVGDEDLAVIVEEGRVVDRLLRARVELRDEVDDADHVGRGLLDRDAELLHLGGELRLRGLHLVLDVDGADVLRVADVEGGHDVREAVARAVGAEVDQALGAVDLLLDRRGDRLRDADRLGAGVGGGDLHLRRRDLGILSDRQQEGAEAPDQQHQ